MSITAQVRTVGKSIRGGRPRRPGRRAAWLLGAGAILVVVVVVGASALTGSSDPGANAADEPPGLATVERGRLTAQVYATGRLGYAARPDGTPYSVVNQATGSYTKLPSAGDEIGCGAPVYRVDDRPVPLLCGRTPLYRPLSEGVRGPDVRALNQNLVELGYAEQADVAGSWRYFGSATAAALAELQDELGLDETGSLDPGEAVFLPGPLRITSVEATAGTAAQPGSPLAQATSTQRRVQVDLDPSQAGDVRIGDRAAVTLPDNSTARGEVTRIGAVAGGEGGGEASGSDPASATIPIFVSLEDDADAGAIDEAPVQVEITTGRVRDALSVPVTALLARAGGGYAVETVASDGERELVPVELGTFDHANGLVEVRGSGLEAGEQVVVPAT
jgi:multidrug efflux pump subunit AcrA (membrane-fusion protein)